MVGFSQLGRYTNSDLSISLETPTFLHDLSHTGTPQSDSKLAFHMEGNGGVFVKDVCKWLWQFFAWRGEWKVPAHGYQARRFKPLPPPYVVCSQRLNLRSVTGRLLPHILGTLIHNNCSARSVHGLMKCIWIAEVCKLFDFLSGIRKVSHLLHLYC